jgi:hypothetical protein
MAARLVTDWLVARLRMFVGMFNITLHNNLNTFKMYLWRNNKEKGKSESVLAH